MHNSLWLKYCRGVENESGKSTNFSTLVFIDVLSKLYKGVVRRTYEAFIPSFGLCFELNSWRESVTIVD